MEARFVVAGFKQVGPLIDQCFSFVSCPLVYLHSFLATEFAVGGAEMWKQFTPEQKEAARKAREEQGTKETH